MRTIVAALALIVAINAHAQVADESARLNEWFEQKYEEQLAFSPSAQTMQGLKTAYSEFDDMSEEAQIAQLEWLRQSVEEMRRDFEYDDLSPQAKVSYDLWAYQYEQAAAGADFRNHQYFFEQMGGAHTALPLFLISFHRVDTVSDMEAYVSRIREVSRAIDQLLDRTRRAAERGIRAPRFAYEGVIDQATQVISGAPFGEGDDSSLWADAQAKIAALVDAGQVDTARADELREAARNALRESLLPSYQRLLAWMDSDMANVAELATGASELPDGEAYYEWALSVATTTDLSAAEVHELGLREVARIRDEMESIKDEVGFEGDLQVFFAFVRDSIDDRRIYFPDTDAGRLAYISEAEEDLDFIAGKLPEFFGILPKADLVVKRVEAFREEDGAAQHYYQGTPDGSRPGIYYAHLSDMTMMPRNQLEVIAYHEGSPGHHMQISIAQELEGIPTFRTQLFFNAYVEGWALYAEPLAKEMGAYGDPHSDFGRLSSEMWRAIRLVVDTGLHARGWTEQQAIDYAIDNSPESVGTTTAEVRRYLIWPGQATGYKIGMLKIQELRAFAEAELGTDFDIRAFHDVVLGGGALPLSLLERQVNDWVAERER